MYNAEPAKGAHMKWMCFLLVLALSMPLLSSCVDRKAAASREEIASIAYFERGDIDKAVESAKSLSSYDLNRSNYLLGQYAIYANAVREGNFSSGLSEDYKRIMSINADTRSDYSTQYLVAKTFSRMFLDGDGKALDFFAGACKESTGLDVNSCAWSILNKVSSPYITSHERMDAIALYEAARVAHDLHLANGPVSSFYMAIALIRLNKSESDDIIKNLESIGQLNPTMKAVYCISISGENLNNAVVDCSSSKKEIKDIILSARQKSTVH